jgi:hypothetical protein
LNLQEELHGGIEIVDVMVIDMVIVVVEVDDMIGK